MAEMRKVEETCAFPNKHKLDLPNSINETLEQKEDAEDDGSDSNKRQKLEISTENEKNVVCSFSVAEKMAVSKDGKEDDYKADENNIKNDHVKVEADLEEVEADKGNGISVEASEEVDIIEEEDDSEEYDSEEYDSEEYDSDYDYSSYDSSDYSSDDSSDYSSYDSSDDSFFSDSSGDDYDSSEFSGLDSDSDDIRFL